MKREILFKAKRVDNGEWIEGDLLHNYCIEYDKYYKTSIRYDINGIYSFPIEVHPETVCQFTGLLAVDKRKVFESDNVKITYGKGDMAGVRVRDGVVIFEDGCFYVKINGSHVKIPFSIIESIAITGNIHDK